MLIYQKLAFLTKMLIKIVLIICWLNFSRISSISTEKQRDQGARDAMNFISDGFDKTKNPCQSFYDYACGSWVTNNRDNAKLYQEEFEKSQLQFQRVLLEDLKSINLSSISTPKKFYDEPIRIFFDKCMEAKIDKQLENVELYNAVKNIIGPMPLLEPETSEIDNVNFDVFSLNTLFQTHLQAEFLFGIKVEPYYIECTLIPTLVFESSIRYDIIRDDESSADGLLLEIAQYLNVTLDKGLLKTKLADTVAFRKALKKLHDVDYSVISQIKLSDLPAAIPEVPWAMILAILFNNADDLDKFVKLNPIVIVRGKNYFHKLGEFVETFSNDTVNNFAYFQVMRAMKKVLTDRSGQLSGGANEKLCFGLTLRHMLPLMLRMRFDRSGVNILDWKYDIELMMQNIFSAFRYLVTGLDWLDSREKMIIMKKIRQLRFDSGIPNWITDDIELKKIMPTFRSDFSLYENDLLNRGKEFARNLKKLLSTKKAAEPDPNFHYGASYKYKQIEAGLGFVLPPFYDLNYPLAKKYGTLGWILSHELVHAFDTEWLTKDEIVGVDAFLNNETLKLFNDKNQCLVKQYSRFCYKDLKLCVRGRRTINDNIADVNGLKIAYLAYKFADQIHRRQTSSKVGHEKIRSTLSSWNVTDDDLFFLSAGRIWCGTGRDLSTDITHPNEVHAPRHARVDVSMMNFPIFAKTYKCSIGSNMAPIEICSLWGDVVESI